MEWNVGPIPQEIIKSGKSLLVCITGHRFVDFGACYYVDPKDEDDRLWRRAAIDAGIKWVFAAEYWRDDEDVFLGEIEAWMLAPEWYKQD